MQSTKIETCRLNAFGEVAPAWNVIRAPAAPPKNAPIRYASVFSRMSGMPMAAAASSSSRIAIQARPRRESRSSSDVPIAIASSASAVQ